MTSHVPIDPLIGTTVSQFEVVAKLGGGGMGVVYKARDLKLGRLVALKFLPPQWSHDEGAKQRFIREAQAASATQHRNICTIHNIETAPDGRLFIVMAYYEGETLKQRLERGALPVGDAVQIGLEIAEGLAKAHSQGVVHRDIKPGNVILTEDGAKIVDFGLAKFADALQLTVPGTTIGTVAYMSPEQTRGEEADAQSDIWAWGIVMFAMLTGAPPFRGAYPEATFYAIKNEPLPALRNARPDIPEALEQIVTPALEKDRAQRYTSAREPARALRLLQGMTLPLDLRTQSVSVPPVRRPPGGVPGARRVITPMPVLLAAAAVALVAAGAWLWAQRPITRVPVAIVPVANHTGVSDLDPYRLALTQTLTEELAESPNVRVVPYLRLLETIRPLILRRGDLSSTEAVQTITTGTGVPFVILPELIYRDRDAAWLLQVQVRSTATGTPVATYETAPVTSSLSQQTAFRLISSAAEQIQQHFKDHGPGRSFTTRIESRRIRDREASRSFEEGLNAYEVMEYQSAVGAFARSAMADDQHALTHAWLSRTLFILGRKSEATTAARRAKALIGDSARDLDAAFTDGVLAESVGDPAAGEAAYTRLTLLSPDQSVAHAELADYLKRRQDRNQQAIEAYHAVLAADPSFLRIHVDLCQLYTRIDDYPLADKEGAAALAGARRAGNASIEAQALMCLAEAQRKSKRDLAEARRLSGEARNLLEPLPQPYNLARAVFYQALMEYTDNRFGAAVKLFTEAATRLASVGNKGMEATALMNLGVATYFTGRPSETLEWFSKSDRAFRDIGDERRAAEMEVNLSGLQVDYNIDTEQARRRLRNARSNLEQMGYVDFQIGALLFEASAEGYRGRLEGSRQLLRAALSQAQDKQLSARVETLTLMLVQSALDAGDYAEALGQLAKSEEAASPAAALTAANAWLEVGDLDAAERALRRAQSALVARNDATLLPSLEAAFGRIEVARSRAGAALEHFDRAITQWTDPLLPVAVVEALCLKGAAEGAIGHLDAARRSLEKGLAAAQRLDHYRLTALCRVERARLETVSHQYAAAVRALDGIPGDDTQKTIGRPLRALVEYWRARAYDGMRDATAPQRLADARQLLMAVQNSVPEQYRQRFEERADVRAMLGSKTNGDGR